MVQYIKPQGFVLITSRLNFFIKPGARYEVNRHVVFKYFDIILRVNRFNKGTFNLPASEVISMQNAAFGMPAFFSQVKFSPANAVELSTESDQLPNPRRTLTAGDTNKIFMAESASSFHCVLNMQFKRVVFRHHRGDTTLSIFGRRLLQRVFGNDANRTKLANLKRKRQPRHTRPNYNEILINSHA